MSLLGSVLGVGGGILGGLLGHKAANDSMEKLMKLQLENTPFYVYRDKANALVDALTGLAGSPINMPYAPDMPGGGTLPIRTGLIPSAISLRGLFSQQFPEYAATLPETWKGYIGNGQGIGPASGKQGTPGVPNGTGPLAQLLALSGYQDLTY